MDVTYPSVNSSTSWNANVYITPLILHLVTISCSHTYLKAVAMCSYKHPASFVHINTVVHTLCNYIVSLAWHAQMQTVAMVTINGSLSVALVPGSHKLDKLGGNGGKKRAWHCMHMPIFQVSRKCMNNYFPYTPADG